MFTSPTAIRVLKRQDPGISGNTIPVACSGSISRVNLWTSRPEWISRAAWKSDHGQLLADETGWPVACCRASRCPRFGLDLGYRAVRMPAKIVDQYRREPSAGKKGVWRSGCRCRRVVCRPSGGMTNCSRITIAVDFPASCFTPHSITRPKMRMAIFLSSRRSDDNDQCRRAPPRDPRIERPSALIQRSRKWQPLTRRTERTICALFVCSRNLRILLLQRQSGTQGEIESTVARNLGTFARPAAIFRRALPKTRSGKILRRHSGRCRSARYQDLSSGRPSRVKKRLLEVTRKLSVSVSEKEQ